MRMQVSRTVAKCLQKLDTEMAMNRIPSRWTSTWGQSFVNMEKCHMDVDTCKPSRYIRIIEIMDQNKAFGCLLCYVKLYNAPTPAYATEMNFGMNHAPDALSLI